MTVPEDQPTPATPATAAETAPAPAAEAVASLSAAVGEAVQSEPPPGDFGSQTAMRSREDAPANFGSQVGMKGGLPPDLKATIEKIERGESGE